MESGPGVTYHAYQESAFGLFANDAPADPAELSAPLAALFEEEVLRPPR